MQTFSWHTIPTVLRLRLVRGIRVTVYKLSIITRMRSSSTFYSFFKENLVSDAEYLMQELNSE